MKTPENGLGINVAILWRLDRPGLRTVLLQPKMSPAPVIVVQVVPKDSAEMPLVQDDHVIQAFPPDRPDHPLDVWVLPGRSLGRPDLLDAQRGDPASEV